MISSRRLIEAIWTASGARTAAMELILGECSLTCQGFAQHEGAGAFKERQSAPECPCTDESVRPSCLSSPVSPSVSVSSEVPLGVSGSAASGVPPIRHRVYGVIPPAPGILCWMHANDQRFHCLSACSTSSLKLTASSEKLIARACTLLAASYWLLA